MTPPDVSKISGNIMLGLFAILGLASFVATNVMQFFITPLDYWFMWAALASGAGAVISGIAGLIFHLDRLQSLRSN